MIYPMLQCFRLNTVCGLENGSMQENMEVPVPSKLVDALNTCDTLVFQNIHQTLESGPTLKERQIPHI